MALARSVRMAAGLFIALLSTETHAITVPPGCDEPTTHPPITIASTLTRKRADKANDGSAEKPWRTLAEVLDPANHLVSTKSYSPNYGRGDQSLHAVNDAGVIRAGDTLYLMSGDHGSPSLLGYANDDFITVSAAPGQTPIITFDEDRKFIALGL